MVQATVETPDIAYTHHSVAIQIQNDGPHTLSLVSVVGADSDETTFLDNIALTGANTDFNGSVAFNDSDVDAGAVLSYALDAPVAGVTLNNDGSYTVDHSDPAYASLAEGEVLEVVASYTITDEHGASDQSTLTVTVTGTNDAPTVSAALTAATDEDEAIFTVDLLAGAADVDNGETATLSVQNVTGLVDGVTLSGSTITVDPANAAFQHLGVGDSDVISVNYEVVDVYGATVAQSATITIDGTNDAPVFAPTASTLGAPVQYIGNGHYYQHVDGEFTWEEAFNASQAAGGYLATITDAAENTFVTNLMGPFEAWPDGVAWIGGSDAAIEGQWRWVDGPEAGDLFWNGAGTSGYIGDYANWWNPVEPNGAFASGEDGLTIGYQGAGLWNDFHTSNEYGYVIEYDTAPGANGPTSGAVTEHTDGTVEENTTNLTDTGVLAFTDVDLTDVHTVSAVAIGNGYLGTMTASVSDASTGDGTGAVTWNFSVPDSAVDYLGAGDSLTQSYTVKVDDGKGGTDTETVTITIQGTNDAPTVVAGGTAAYVENDAATVIDAALTLSDVDDTNLESASVAITGGFVAGEDSLSFTNQNGIIGSYNAATGILALSGTATVAQYQAAMASVSYANSSENPDTSDRTVSFGVNDGDVDSTIATSTVTVAAVNDAPSILGATSVGATTVNDIQDYNVPNSTGNGGFNSAYNGLPGGQIDGRAITDFATGDVISFTVTGVNYFFALYDGDNNMLAPFDGLYSNQHPSGFTGSYTVSGGADTTLRWFLGGNNQTGGNPSYSVTALAVTGKLDVDEDTSGLFTGLSIADPDVGASDISVTLDVANGDLALTSIAGLTQADADGTDGTLAFSGSLADVNAALAGLEYTGDADFNGQDFLNIAVDDGGNTGTGGAMSDAKSVVINVEAVNDAPILAVTDLAATEDGASVSGTPTFTDVDATDAHSYSVTAMAAGEGSVAIDAGTGVYTYSPGSDFQSLATGETTTVSFDVTIADDNGGSDTQTVTVTITGTNDAPEVVAIDAGTVTEDDAVQVIDLLDGQTDIDNGAVLSTANIVVTDDLGNAVTFTDNGDGTISIDPVQYDALNDGQDRTVTVAYDVSDGIDSTATTATLVVEGVNDNEPPVANDDVLGGATLSETQISGANIAVLDNSGIVDTSGGSGSESDTIQASLVQAGHIVSPFTGLDAASIQAALSSADVLVIPEQESGDLGNTLSAASSAAIRDFIADGGTLVVSYDYRNSLNEIFGFSLSLSSGGTSSLTSDAVGTTFEDGPATIPNLSATGGFLTSSLPTGSLSIYENGSSSTVAVIPFGNGQITTIGWDWWYAQPMGSQDSGWLDVLNRSISLTDVLETTDEDTAHTIAAAELLANDTDPDGDSLVISAVSGTSSQGATVTLNGDGSVGYDPTTSASLDAMAEGENLEDTFTYTVSDGNGGFDTATATLVVEGLNDGPPAGIHDLNDQSDSYVGTAGLVDTFIFDIDVGTTDGVNSLISITNFEMGVDRLVFQSENPVTSSSFDHRYSDGLGHENLIGDDFNLEHTVAGHQTNAGVHPNNGDNEFSIYGGSGAVDSIEINTFASDVAIALGAWGPDTPHYISGNMISTIGSAYNSASDENIDLYLGAEVSGINPLWYDGDILTF